MHVEYVALLLSLQQSDPPGCTESFLVTESMMQYVEVNLIAIYEREQRLYPSIGFSCDATPNKWTVVGWIGEGSSHPELQVWRPTGLDCAYGFCSRYDIAMSFPLVGSDLQPRSDQQNVYDFIPNEEVTISSGNVLGLFHPAFNESSFIVHYQIATGPLNYGVSNRDSPSNNITFSLEDFNYPMVTVDVTPGICKN